MGDRRSDRLGARRQQRRRRDLRRSQLAAVTDGSGREIQRAAGSDTGSPLSRNLAGADERSESVDLPVQRYPNQRTAFAAVVIDHPEVVGNSLEGKSARVEPGRLGRDTL